VPVVAALAGTIAIGTILGVGAGAAALIVIAALMVVRLRRRKTCEPLRSAEGPLTKH
jgi:hypothetical protein